MKLVDLQKKKIPDAPGVYFFLGPRKNILYIGKATSLKNRVRSYFDGAIKDKRSALIEKMVAQAKTVEWTVTDSVLEAMILEVNLIRTHKPRCNTISKDDKSFNHLIITDEEYPRVLVLRSKDLMDMFSENEPKYVFGPFPNGTLFREALKIVRRLFQFYDLKRPVGETTSKMGKGKIDFNRQIGLYPNVQSKAEYARTIRHIKLFFEGKKQQVITELERLMMRAARQEDFEEAQKYKQKVFALKHIRDIALLKDDTRIHRDDRSFRIEAYDVAHLGGDDMVGVMTVLESGAPNTASYRRFKINSVTASNDPAALKEIFVRRLGHPEWPLPQLIVVDGSTAQKNVIERELKSRSLLIPVVGVVKNEKHQPERVIGPADIIKQQRANILLANAEAHRYAINFHRTRRSKRYQS